MITYINKKMKTGANDMMYFNKPILESTHI